MDLLCSTGNYTQYYVIICKRKESEKEQRDFPGSSESKESSCKAGDLGSIPGSGRSPGEGNGYLLQNSCLENAMDGAAW